MKIVLLSLFYLIPLFVVADPDNSCVTNYYEINGKRTCLWLVDRKENVFLLSDDVIDDELNETFDSDEDLKALDPDMSDPVPDF